MKLIRRLSLCLLAPLVIATAVWAETPKSDYEKAVQAYVQAAGNEVQALKAQADQAFKSVAESRREASQEFYAAFEKYAAAFEQLKAAGPKDFDTMKARYEKERQAATAALATAQKS